jgi:hypothetical protein
MPIAGMTTKRRGAVMGSDAFSPTGEQLDDAGTTETVFFVHYDRRSQMIILPRQARDKYKGQLKKKDVFSQEREVLERTSVAEALSPACSRARSCSPLRDRPLEQARLAATALRLAGSGLVRGNALF